MERRPILIALCVLLGACDRGAPEAWCAGMIARDTFAPGGFRLEPLVCDSPFRPPPLEVVYRGGATAAICEGSDVYVTGYIVEGRLVATSVKAVRLGKYDGDCYLTRCLPAWMRPARCDFSTRFR